MTTTDLVPVFAGTLAGIPAQLCNARDLHAALSVGRDFTTWIKERIDEYAFVEGEDYSPVSGNIRGRGKPRTDYHLTLDMAKELAMIENNDQGRQVRRYFIAMEKQARQQATPPALQASETEIDRQKRSRINRRALELTHRAYETYRDQMRTCPRILGGLVEIEQWLPPELAGNIVADAQRLAAVCDIFRENISKSADTIARMAGLADE